MARQTRELIDEAAEAVGKTRSEFMVESARMHAIDVLLDKRLFSLGTEHYDAFLKALDAPPAPNEKLKRLLRASRRGNGNAHPVASGDAYCSCTYRRQSRRCTL